MELVNKIITECMTSKDKPTVVSPVSLALSLYLAAIASGGETQEEICNLLESDPMCVREDFEDFLEEFYTPQHVNGILDINNHIFYDKGLGFKGGYLKNINVDAFDKLSPESRKRVNEIIKEETNGLLSGPQLTEKDDLLFINTLYFKDKWSPSTAVELVKEPKPFTNSNGEVVKVPFIKGKLKRYTETAGGQLALISYDSDCTFVAFQPNDTRILPDLLKRNRLLEDLIKISIYSDEVGKSSTFRIPSFSATSDIDFNKTSLPKLIPTAYSEDADFTTFFSEQTKLKRTEQQCHITVDEKGTEAAAVTAFGATLKGGTHKKVVHAVFDKPFVYMVISPEDDIILYCGVVDHLK